MKKAYVSTNLKKVHLQTIWMQENNAFQLTPWTEV